MHTPLVDEATKDTITVTKVQDGSKNTVIAISGNIKDKRDSTFFPIDTSKMTGVPKNLRLDNLHFLIETGLRVIISYDDQPFFLPIEGRGKFEIDKLGGLTGHQINLTFKGVGCFMIMLDISKMGI